jgi:hypothetical protein
MIGWFGRGKKGSMLLSVVVLLLVMGLVAGEALATAYLKNSYARFSATAGETLAIGDVVCLKDSDVYAYKADSDNATALRPAVGIVTKGGAGGTSVGITTYGIFGGYSSLAEGAPAYLSATAGAVTQTAPSGYLQQIGIAISTTSYLFDFQAGKNECVATHDFDNGTTAWTMTGAEAACQYVYASNAGGSVDAVLPAAYPGRVWFINNQSGQVLTFKVTGGSGGTIASTKTGIYAGNATDAVEIYEKP